MGAVVPADMSSCAVRARRRPVPISSLRAPRLGKGACFRLEEGGHHARSSRPPRLDRVRPGPSPGSEDAPRPPAPRLAGYGRSRTSPASPGAQRRGVGRDGHDQGTAAGWLRSAGARRSTSWSGSGALLALGAATSTLRATVDRAIEAGATEAEIVGRADRGGARRGPCPRRLLGAAAGRGHRIRHRGRRVRVEVRSRGRCESDAARVWWLFVAVGVASLVAGVILITKPSNSLATLAVVVGHLPAHRRRGRAAVGDLRTACRGTHARGHRRAARRDRRASC